MYSPAATWCQLCSFCVASHRAMRTPSSSARLLKAKLFPSPARKRGVLMKRCSPRGRRGSQFDMKNLLSKSPRSSNLRSHTTSATGNSFSMKSLLETTPRSKRAHSSSAITPEPSCEHKRKSFVGSVTQGTVDTVTPRSLFKSLPQQSATKGDVLMKASPGITAGEVHQIEAISEDNHPLLPTLEANVQEKFPSLKYRYIHLNESSGIKEENVGLKWYLPLSWFILP